MADTPNAPQGSGLAPNLAGLLAYLVMPLTGILFLMLEKRDPFVRFHAAQATVVGAVLVVAWVALSVLSMVPFVGWLVGLLASIALGFGGFVLWLFLMFQAFSGKEWELPWAGAQARRMMMGSALAR